MCGIAGSINLEDGHSLYLKNLTRGSFASGAIIFNEHNFLCIKQEQVFTLEQLQEITTFIPTYVLFHSRAPTNTGEQLWSSSTTHPFKSKNFYVAQNGIILNYKKIQGGDRCSVDTEVIPYNLARGQTLKSIYEQLDGLLTSWVFNEDTKQVHIVKAGSSLYTDGASFSSNIFEDSYEIKDGTILTFTNKHLEETETFNYENPYFL